MGNSITSYKLYGIPYLGSMAIELLMEEAGIKYDIIFPTTEERNSVEFKKISPRGLVPVLITPSGQSIFEGPAIINFLLETHNTNLIAPIGNPDRPDIAIAVLIIVLAATAPAIPSRIIIIPAKYIDASPKFLLSE